MASDNKVVIATELPSGDPGVSLASKSYTHSTLGTLHAEEHVVAGVVGLPQDLLHFRMKLTGPATNTALATPALGKKLVVTRLSVRASAKNSEDTDVHVGFGNNPPDSKIVLAVTGLSRSGVAQEGNGSGPVGASKLDDEALTVTATDPVNGALEIAGTYYEVD